MEAMVDLAELEAEVAKATAALQHALSVWKEAKETTSTIPPSNSTVEQLWLQVIHAYNVWVDKE